jgi:phosphoribosylglycinamide formyltransferase-1
MSKRIVVLISGRGSNMEAIVRARDAEDWPARIAGVVSNRPDAAGLAFARDHGITTAVVDHKASASRDAFDDELTHVLDAFEPDLVVLAGFMKLVGEEFLERFGGRIVNTHPALSPSFPGMTGPADALEYGVKVTGATLFVVDAGVDSGPIVAQAAVPVADDDTVATLHERIKVAERQMLVESVGRMAREGFTVSNRKVRFGQ